MLFNINKKMGKLIKLFWNTIESSDFLSEQIFKNKIHCKLWSGTWDVTSLVLKKTIDNHCDFNVLKYLDIGCGHVALFGQYVKKKFPFTEVVSSDLYENVLKSAKQNVEKNSHEINLKKSNLFSKINGKFNLITANLPYVPLTFNHNIKKGTVRYNSRYSGKDGTELSRKFLKEAKKHLEKNGRVFFGVNCFYISEEKCKKMIKQYGYKIDTIVKIRFNTAKVFIIKRK